MGEDVDFLLRDDLTPELVHELTHYEILGFEKYGNGVGEEGLKKAYRKAVLKYHPDKTGVQDGEEDEVGLGWVSLFFLFLACMCSCLVFVVSCLSGRRKGGR